MNKQITIDGVEYNFNTEAAKRVGLLTPVTTLYKIGDKFIDETTKYLYILAHVSDRSVLLVNTQTGNHYKPPFRVVNVHRITPKEWEEIGDEDFTLKK